MIIYDLSHDEDATRGIQTIFLESFSKNSASPAFNHLINFKSRITLNHDQQITENDGACDGEPEGWIVQFSPEGISYPY